MILRPRQVDFVDRCVSALYEHGDTLGIAVTGFGKTISLAGACRRIFSDRPGSRAMVMAHRDELTEQNMSKFTKVCPSSVSRFDSKQKSQRGRATFGMVQTMANHLDKLKPVDVLVIDEAHHTPANTYQKVIKRYRELNPNTMIFGLTATPDRADKAGLGVTFTNVADQVTIGEMIMAGHLVMPRALTIDIGTQDELRALKVKRTANDYDQAEIEAIQNRPIQNEQVVEHWAREAGNRQTVFFSSTIQHAEDVAETFRRHGYAFEAVHGQMAKKERQRILSALDYGQIQGVVNPMILTEGWDSQPVSCVGLLRMSSHKSTMIQMVGRGLRKVDPVIYPGMVKTDCVILDFGISLLSHGDLETEVRMNVRKPKEGQEQQKKECPQCGSPQPIQTRLCPICGYEYKSQQEDDALFDINEEFRLIEIDLIGKSPFRWVDLWGDGYIMMTCGFNTWASVTSPDGESYFAIGGYRDGEGGRWAVQLLGAGNRVQAISSADDHMRQREKSRAAKKRAEWMNAPMTDNQRNHLVRFGYAPDLPFSKIEAAAHMTFWFQRERIERLMGVAA